MTQSELYSKAMRCRDRTAGNETQYSIFEDEDTVYLSIQGSVQKQDWLFNFMFWASPLIWKPYKKMKSLWFAHAGFSKAWKLARDQIGIEVTTAIAGHKKLVCLGYSHGAALALLAHEYFTFAGIQTETHVFGCPRVLWLPSKTIRERFDNCHLYQNRGDIVTMVPFWLMGYRHVGHITKVGKCRFPSHIPHLDYSDTLKTL